MKKITRLPMSLAMLLVAACAAAGTASPALASDPLGFRHHISLGAWTGSFQQSDAVGHEVNVRTLTSLGLEAGLGAGFGLFFVDYNVTWFIANHTLSVSTDANSVSLSQPSNREGPYFAPYGVTAGVSLPFVPIDPYIGLEKGSFGFSAGAKTNYSGLTGKLGLNFHFMPELGLRLEYRKHYLTSDDAGSLPAGVTTRFTSWYLGLAAGRF